MNAGSTRFLRQTGDEFFDLLAGDHHQIRQFIDDDDDVRHATQRLGRLRGQAQRIRNRLTLLGGFLDMVVGAGQVTYAQLGHDLVAAFHLGHTPGQGIGGLTHIGHDRREQMRDAFIDRQFQHLGVDQNQTHRIRLGFIEHRQDHGVNADRFTGTRGTRHQQMRHLGQIGDDRLAADVLTQRHGQRRSHVVIRTRGQNFRQTDGLPFRVRQFEGHAGLARHGFDDAYRNQRQRPRQIARQINDLRTLDADRRFDFITRDDRARIGRDNFNFNAKIAEASFDEPRSELHRFFGRHIGGRLSNIEQTQRRQRTADHGLGE